MYRSRYMYNDQGVSLLSLIAYKTLRYFRNMKFQHAYHSIEEECSSSSLFFNRNVIKIFKIKLDKKEGQWKEENKGKREIKE